MKRKIFLGFGIVIFVLLLNFIYFVVTFGSLAADPPSLGEKISVAFSHPDWLSPFYTIIISVSNPLFTLFLIVLCVALYYLYDNFIKNKKETTAISLGQQVESVESKNEFNNNDSKIEFFDDKALRAKSRDRLFKKIVLWATPVLVIYIVFVFLSFSEPGMGLPALVFLMPVMPIIYIFYPVYFIILSIRYSREKGSMDPLDKIMFYILLIPIAFLGIFAAYKIYSGNLIQEAFINRQREASIAATIAQEDAKIAGLADLVIKDININSDELDIKYCNESDKVNRKRVTMKIETDKGYSDTFPNYLMPQPGKCEESRMFIVKYFNIKMGDTVGIMVTLDPENKVNETNKENNKMTKSIIFGKVIERQQDLKRLAPEDVVKQFYGWYFDGYKYSINPQNGGDYKNKFAFVNILVNLFNKDNATQTLIDRNQKIFRSDKFRNGAETFPLFCSDKFPNNYQITDASINGESASVNIVVDSAGVAKISLVLIDGIWRASEISCLIPYKILY
jgi:hypothetical protein